MSSTLVVLTYSCWFKTDSFCKSMASRRESMIPPSRASHLEYWFIWKATDSFTLTIFPYNVNTGGCNLCWCFWIANRPCPKVKTKTVHTVIIVTHVKVVFIIIKINVLQECQILVNLLSNICIRSSYRSIKSKHKILRWFAFSKIDPFAPSAWDRDTSSIIE